MLGFFPLEGEVSPADYEDEVRAYQAQYGTLATLKEGNPNSNRNPNPNPSPSPNPTLP